MSWALMMSQMNADETDSVVASLFQYAFVACALFMHTVCYAPKCQLWTIWMSNRWRGHVVCGKPRRTHVRSGTRTDPCRVTSTATNACCHGANHVPWSVTSHMALSINAPLTGIVHETWCAIDIKTLLASFSCMHSSVGAKRSRYGVNCD